MLLPAPPVAEAGSGPDHDEVEPIFWPSDAPSDWQAPSEPRGSFVIQPVRAVSDIL
jgi:hypothetical protein